MWCQLSKKVTISVGWQQGSWWPKETTIRMLFKLSAARISAMHINFLEHMPEQIRIMSNSSSRIQKINEWVHRWINSSTDHRLSSEVVIFEKKKLNRRKLQDSDKVLLRTGKVANSITLTPNAPTRETWAPSRKPPVSSKSSYMPMFQNTRDLTLNKEKTTL